MDLIQMLVEMQGGGIAIHANQKLAELMNAINGTGGKGTITVTLTIAPAKREFGGRVSQLDVDADIKIKKPELPLGTSIFFVTEEGGLTREDPKQAELFGEKREK